MINANDFAGKRKKIDGIMKLSVPKITKQNIKWEWCSPPNCHKQMAKRLRDIIVQKKLRGYQVFTSGQKVSVVKNHNVNLFGVASCDKEYQPVDFINYLKANNN